MIEIQVDSIGLNTLLQNMNKATQRAAEQALDFTVKDIALDERREMQRVFDRPTPYTLNSLQVIPTRNHNMIAGVEFKSPDRMQKHYLVPEVEGGRRALKGFEKYGMGGKAFIPGSGAKLDRFGNMSAGQIRQIMSVLGTAEYASGYSANLTARSSKRNRKPRDYVYLPNGSGKLPPGIYQRVQTGVGFGAKTKKTLPFGEYQKGRTRGKFASVVRARGLVPILIQNNQLDYSPRLPFYQIAEKIANERFNAHFMRLLGF